MHAKYWMLIAVGIFGVVGFRAQWAGADESGPEQLSGSALYAKYCSSCHGSAGGGDTPFGGLLRVAPPDLTRIAQRRDGWFPEVLIREIIDGRFVVHGLREMPIWGHTLTHLELIAITEHLYGLQVPSVESVE